MSIVLPAEFARSCTAGTPRYDSVLTSGSVQDDVHTRANRTRTHRLADAVATLPLERLELGNRRHGHAHRAGHRDLQTGTPPRTLVEGRDQCDLLDGSPVVAA